MNRGGAASPTILGVAPMHVARYSSADEEDWDDFVGRSKNGTFLFRRAYMGYHANRFTDHSLLVYDESDLLVALLPANEQESALVSHGGLTYGGVLTCDTMRATTFLGVFEAIVDYARTARFSTIFYKSVPGIYHRAPADEDLYALFRWGARLYRRDLSTAVELPGGRLQERRRRGVRRAEKQGVVASETDRWQDFWAVLEENLATAHGLQPVHRIDEILSLHSAFPENIRLFGAFRNDRLLAGAVIYESDRVAHAQYIASSPAGRQASAIDLLFWWLITQVFSAKRYFNFGISTEQEGRHLNAGLVDFKEGFGGSSVVHDFYRLDLDGTPADAAV